MVEHIPLVIEFTAGSRIENNIVLLKDGTQVSLPSRQIVHGDQTYGAARVGLGGMSFEGIQGEQMVFWRVKDLIPESARMSDGFNDDGDDKMLLDFQNISRVLLQGIQVWPRTH